METWIHELLIHKFSAFFHTKKWLTNEFSAILNLDIKSLYGNKFLCLLKIFSKDLSNNLDFLCKKMDIEKLSKFSFLPKP